MAFQEATHSSEILQDCRQRMTWPWPLMTSDLTPPMTCPCVQPISVRPLKETNHLVGYLSPPLLQVNNSLQLYTDDVEWWNGGSVFGFISICSSRGLKPMRISPSVTLINQMWKAMIGWTIASRGQYCHWRGCVLPSFNTSVLCWITLAVWKWLFFLRLASLQRSRLL